MRQYRPSRDYSDDNARSPFAVTPFHSSCGSNNLGLTHCKHEQIAFSVSCPEWLTRARKPPDSYAQTPKRDSMCKGFVSMISSPDEPQAVEDQCTWVYDNPGRSPQEDGCRTGL